MIIEEFRQAVSERCGAKMKALDSAKDYGIGIRTSGLDLRDGSMCKTLMNKLGDCLRGIEDRGGKQPDMIVLYQTPDFDGKVQQVGFYFVA